MRRYQLNEFGEERLTLARGECAVLEPGEVRVAIGALSINYRDLLVIRGQYNPRLALPIVPLSDGAGEVIEVGPQVDRFAVGDRVTTHFVSGWLEGPYRGEYASTTLGTPGPGVACDEVALPADALVRTPSHLDDGEAATLPIAALTAWSALVTEGNVRPGDSVLTLGTGGVSIFALQLGCALGADVWVTSKSDEKLARATALGAVQTINYRTHPQWEREVRTRTEGRGVDLVVENGGVGTLSQSLVAVRPGGTVALLGALTGLQGEVDIAPILMKRVRVAGILVDSRSAFEAMLSFIETHQIKPIVHRRYPFESLATALGDLASGDHFGKIVIEMTQRDSDA